MSLLLLLSVVSVVSCGRFGFEARAADGGADIDGNGADDAGTVDALVAECPEIPTVQSGELALADDTTFGVGIEPVDPSCSFVICERRTGSASPRARAICTLISPTELGVETGEESASTIVRWQVVSGARFSVRRGVLDFAALDLEKTETLAVVNGESSLALVTSYGNDPGSDADERASVAVSVEGLNIVARRGESGTTARSAWQLVEIAGADVQRADATMAAGQLALAVPFTEVALDRSFVSISINAHRDTDGEDAAHAVAASLPAGNLVQLSRTFAEDPMSVSVQLVQLPVGSALVERETISSVAPHDDRILVGVETHEPTGTLVYTTLSIESGAERTALTSMSATTELDGAGRIRLERGAAAGFPVVGEATAISFDPE